MVEGHSCKKCDVPRKEGFQRQIYGSVRFTKVIFQRRIEGGRGRESERERETKRDREGDIERERERERGRGRERERDSEP